MNNYEKKNLVNFFTSHSILDKYVYSFSEMLNNYEILSEDTVSSFIANCENRYINRFRNSRVKAAKILSTKNIKDKILCTDQSIGINKK